MFDNIGGKIKALAKVTCIVGIVASVIGAISLWIANSRNNPTILMGIIVLVVGCLASWVGSFFCYGFGELIENTAAQKSYLSHLKDEESRNHVLLKEMNSTLLRMNLNSAPAEKEQNSASSASFYLTDL